MRRTQFTNMIRGHAAEFGITAARGLDKIEPLLARIAADPVCRAGQRHVCRPCRGVAELKPKLRGRSAAAGVAPANELSRRLAEVPAIGPIGASLLVMITDPTAFRTGRDFAAWLGLTPKDHSTAGKQRLGGITRAGDEILRSVLVVGATSVIQHAKKARGKPSPWLAALIKRKPPKLAAVALANKTARIAWKLMVSGERYDRNRAAAAPAAKIAA